MNMHDVGDFREYIYLRTHGIQVPIAAEIRRDPTDATALCSSL